jgi:hypothetical protein
MAKKWKALLETALAAEYPGTTIKWDGDDPTLVVPDELESKVHEIVEYATAVVRRCLGGGEVKFYPTQRRVRRTG